MKLLTCSLLVPCLFLISVTCSAQKLQVNALFGLQPSNLNWQISGKDKQYTLSELRWKDVKCNRYDVGLRHQLSQRFIVGGNLALLHAYSGKVNDIDYSEHEPYGIISDAEYAAHQGSGHEINLYAGYSILKFKQPNALRVVGGVYSNNRQFSLLGNITEAFDLKSSYNNKWMGCTLGVEGEFRTGRFSFTEKMDIGLLAYRAEANWNLIAEFKHPVSFKHSANGYMYASNTSARYRLYKKLDLIYRFSIESLRTWYGEDKLFYNNGTIAISQLNKVKQVQYYNSAGLAYSL